MRAPEADRIAAPSWRWAIRRNLVRGPWPVILVVLGAILAAHVLLRPTWWRYEWFWAWYQYQFSTILVGPVVAGIASVWGASWSKARGSIEPSGRVGPTLVAALVALAVPITLVYLLGLAGVSVVVARTTGSAPDAATLGTVFPALALLLACAAVGLGAGYRSGVRSLAPVWTLGVFALLMATYTAFPDRFGKVGGATASLVGLRTRPVVELGQVFEFTGIAIVAIALAGLGRRSRGGLAGLAAGVVVAGLGIAVLVPAGSNEFEARPVHLACRGSGPTICLADGWTAAEPELRAILGRYDRALVAAGLPRFRTYTQAYPAPRGQVPFDPVFVLRYGPEGPADGLVINQWLPDDCLRWTDVMSASVETLEGYLQRAWAADGRLAVPEAEQARLAAALDVVRTCDG